jgi:hypothetical protein
LIKQWLDAPVEERDGNGKIQRKRNRQGTPQVRFDEGEGSRWSLPVCSHPVASFSTLRSKTCHHPIDAARAILVRTPQPCDQEGPACRGRIGVFAKAAKRQQTPSAPLQPRRLDASRGRVQFFSYGRNPDSRNPFRPLQGDGS